MKDSKDKYISLPKVLLHDHLDGGVRPETIIELAEEEGYADLPSQDPDELIKWISRGADRKSLELYLETFVHTVAISQTAPSICRVAKECAEDLAADGVVYAEIRMAPELCTEKGMSLDDVVEAMLEGFRQGSEGSNVEIGLICCAMRQMPNALEIAKLTVRWADKGVVAFDVAGPEDGFPPKNYLEAFQHVQAEGLPITIHAGEAYGPPSVAQALECGADRLGHGVRIIEDTSKNPDGELIPGTTAQEVKDRQIPLEVCPKSNIHTGISEDLASHPVDDLYRAGFNITLNTDNRLMSRTMPSSEIGDCVETFGWSMEDLHKITMNGVQALFLDQGKKDRLMEETINPWFKTQN